jgi:osmotically-inducible protein OsmY
MRNWIVIGALASAMSVGACQRGPDVEKMADGALESVALDDKVDANFDKGAGVVRLSGTVDSVANEIVVEGAHAEAADDLDSGIEERFETLVAKSTDINANDVDLRVENGVVTLTGTVPTDAERTKVEGLVRSIPGVQQVVNSVTVARK